MTAKQDLPVDSKLPSNAHVVRLWRNSEDYEGWSAFRDAIALHLKGDSLGPKAFKKFLRYLTPSERENFISDVERIASAPGEIVKRTINGVMRTDFVEAQVFGIPISGNTYDITKLCTDRERLDALREAVKASYFCSRTKGILLYGVPLSVSNLRKISPFHLNALGRETLDSFHGDPREESLMEFLKEVANADRKDRVSDSATSFPTHADHVLLGVQISVFDSPDELPTDPMSMLRGEADDFRFMSLLKAQLEWSKRLKDVANDDDGLEIHQPLPWRGIRNKLVENRIEMGIRAVLAFEPGEAELSDVDLTFDTEDDKVLKIEASHNDKLLTRFKIPRSLVAGHSSDLIRKLASTYRAGPLWQHGPGPECFH